MSRVRLRLHSFVAVCLFWQLATFAVGPALSAAGIDPHRREAECDCPGTDPGAACPMHTGPARSERSGTDGLVTSACPPQDAALLSLAIGLGVLPEIMTVDALSGVASVRPAASAATSCLAFPDLPPPRA
jgi:hypothetical protein